MPRTWNELEFPSPNTVVRNPDVDALNSVCAIANRPATAVLDGFQYGQSEKRRRSFERRPVFGRRRLRPRIDLDCEEEMALADDARCGKRPLSKRAHRGRIDGESELLAELASGRRGRELPGFHESCRELPEGPVMTGRNLAQRTWRP